MFLRKAVRMAVALTAITFVGNAITTVPAMAIQKKTKKAAATTYECTHCKIKMSAADAKKHNMKCDCGMKLTPVKKGKKA